jgi:hypothetical protein
MASAHTPGDTRTAVFEPHLWGNHLALSDIKSENIQMLLEYRPLLVQRRATKTTFRYRKK